MLVNFSIILVTLFFDCSLKGLCQKSNQNGLFSGTKELSRKWDRGGFYLLIN